MAIADAGLLGGLLGTHQDTLKRLQMFRSGAIVSCMGNIQQTLFERKNNAEKLIIQICFPPSNLLQNKKFFYEASYSQRVRRI